MIPNDSRDPGCSSRAGYRSRNAQRIVDLVQAQGWKQVPGARVLAEELNLSVYQVRAALDTLREAGAVTFCRGSHIGTVVAAQSESQQTSVSSAERTAESIREMIISGALRPGTPVPKISSFAMQYSVNNRTVRRSFEILEELGHIHRQGRGWVVGPRVSISTRFQKVPAALALILPVESWARYRMSSDRTSKFYEELFANIERSGLRTLPLIVSSAGDSDDFKTAIDNACSRIRALGDSVRGVLLCGKRKDYQGGFEELVLALDTCPGPLVWFDESNETTKSEVSAKKLVRAIVDQNAAIDCCLDCLASHGHRTVAYVLPVGKQQWALERGKTLVARGAAREPGLDVRCIGNAAAIHEEVSWEKVGRVFELCRRHGSAVTRSMDQVVACWIDSNGGNKRWVGSSGQYRALYDWIAHTGAASLPGVNRRDAYNVYLVPLLISVLEQPDITSIIVASDWGAEVVYPALVAIGIDVPHDISLISFDNYPFLRPFPVSSVDFGLGNLGYAAFHLLVHGGTGSRRQAEDTLTARPMVIHRGSISPTSAASGFRRYLLKW